MNIKRKRDVLGYLLGEGGRGVLIKTTVILIKHILA